METLADAMLCMDDRLSIYKEFAPQLSFNEGLSIDAVENDLPADAPSIAVNLPVDAGVTFNFVQPELDKPKGEFTDLVDDLDGTVKADPFNDTAVPNPEDPDAEDFTDELEEGETATDQDEARFLTLQDLM